MRESVQAVSALRSEAAALHAKLHQFPRVVHRKHPQQNLIEQRENRRCGANAQCECGDRRHGEAGIQPQLPHAKPDILTKRFKPSNGTHCVLLSYGG